MIQERTSVKPGSVLLLVVSESETDDESKGNYICETGLEELR